jgi:hypothetical protein
MSSWRTFGLGAAVLLLTAAIGASLTSIAVVAPPVIAALLVLFGAALAVDYFGFARRQVAWRGSVAPSAASRAMLRALERRFARERAAGAMRTATTARSLLIGLAEHHELRRAAEVVDFLATDAATRAHRDLDADALRALALAEIGRLDEAHVIDRAIGPRHGGVPVVAYLRGRLAELDGRPRPGLEALDRVLRGPDRRGVARDLGLLRARLLVRSGRLEDARVELDLVARGGGRAAVEALIGGDAGVALAARQALGLGAVYR